MTLRVACPHCAREIFALPESAGKVGHCACGGSFAVPAAPARRPPSTRTAALLVAAAVGVGLTAGLLPGKRSAAARQDTPPSATEGPGATDVGRAGPPALPSLPGGQAIRSASLALGGSPEPSSPGPAPMPTLSARDLFLLYQQDPAGADARYHGRRVWAHGELAPPPAGAEDGCVAGLVTFGAEEVPPAAYPDPVPSRAGVLLRATPPRQADFRALPGGSAVAVEGRCVGWRADPGAHGGGLVVLEDCRLVVRPKN